MTARVYDCNGWFEVPANPLSTAGVFEYRGSKIDGAPDPSRMYKVYRAPDELQDPETLDSFRLVPFVIKHAMLGDPAILPPGKQHYVPPEQKGVHGVIGDKIWFDPQLGQMGGIRGNLKIFSAQVPRTMRAGVQELSLGYHCKYIPESGVAPDGTPYQYRQTKIRGNHVALVPDGKCGETVSVMDELQTCFDAKDMLPMAHEPLKKRNLLAHTAIVKMLVGGYRGKMAAKFGGKIPALAGSVAAMDAKDEEAVASEPGLSDVAEILGDVLPQIADINATISDATAPDDDDMEMDMAPEMDAAGKPAMDAEGKPKMKPVLDAAGKPKMKKKVAPAMDKGAMKEVADKAAMDAAEKIAAPLRAELAELRRGGIKAVLGEISQRNALAGKLAGFVGVFDHSEMTLDEVANYGVTKLEIPGVTKGQEVSAITAYLHGRAAPNANVTYVAAMDARDPKNPLKDYLNPKAA